MLPGILLLAGISGGCRGAAGPDLAPIEVPRDDVESLVRSGNRFALDLYRRVGAGEGNRFLSPTCIAAALGMTSAGAAGTTAQQMAQTLRLDLPPDRVHPAFHAHLLALSPPGGRDDVTLAIANALWAQKGRTFLPSYTSVVTTHYAAEARVLDFASDPEGSRGTVNRWVEDHTEDRIRDLLPQGSVDALTRLVLTSAIYFKGTWDEEFRPASTRTEPFRLAGGGEAPAQFMTQKEGFGFAGLEGLSLLEMPYEGKRLSMVVILPDEVAGLPALEESLTLEILEGWLAAIRHEEVTVFLPRFRFTAATDLAPVLQALGMTDAFGDRADFSAMDGTRELYLQAAVHKAFVQVDEEGTEAAAATGIAVGAKMEPGEPIVFRADHPFLFLVRDRESGAILFLGRVAEPVEE